jgi:hypothetical protein
MRWLVGSVVGAVMAVGAAAATAAQAPPTPGAYAILGLEDVALGPGVRIEQGDVGANRGEATIGAGARIAGSVAADTIRVHGGARVADLFCRLVIGPERFGCGALASPVVDVASLPLVQVVPGAADVRVPAHGSTAPLAAGAYAAVRVAARGRLLLAGGDYAVRSITLARRARLLCASACRIAVEGRLVLQGRAILAAAAPLDAHAVRIDVERGGADAVVTGPGAIVAGSIYAPAGDVVLGSGGRYTGGFVGRSVAVRAGARVTGASAL